MSVCCTFDKHSAINSCVACILKTTVHGATLPTVRLGMLSVMIWCELTWFMWSDNFVKWSEVSYGEVLGDKVPCTLVWPYTDGAWLYCDYFVLCVSCTVVVLTFFVICGCVCVCVCGFCNVWLFWQLCVCFGNTCTCIYCVLYCFVYVYFFLFVTNVRTTATEWKLNYNK